MPCMAAWASEKQVNVSRAPANIRAAGAGMAYNAAISFSIPFMPPLFKKSMLIVAGLLMAMLIAVWLSVKINAAEHAKLYSQAWSPSGKCVINTYAPAYGSGTISNIVRALSTQSFFRVYDKQGGMLESSEWVLDLHEDGLQDVAYWGKERAFYPTDMGYESWTLRQCV